MSGSDEAKDAITIAKSGDAAARLPEEPAPPVPLQEVPRPSEQIAATPAPRREDRSKACRTDPVAMPSILELPPSTIDTDVRRRGVNPVLTGVTAGIIALVVVFLFGFVYLVVSYLRYTGG